MKVCEAVYVLKMFRESCEKEHMDTEVEACDLAIRILNFWDLNVQYILSLEQEREDQ